MKKKQVLLIEDDRTFASIVTELLQEKGAYEVSVARNGKEGLDQAREKNVDLIILDLTLPKLPGEQVCRELKGDEETRGIPILMVTAKDSATEKVVGMVIGADRYLTKPVDLETLLEAIKELAG